MIKTLQRIIFLVIILCLNFTVAFSAESKTYGQLLYDLNLVHGLDEGLGESTPITRGEMIVLLVRLLDDGSQLDNLTPTEMPSFTDVPVSHWAYREIETAKQKNLTAGLGDGTFGINDTVTYAQTLLFLARALEYDMSNTLYINSVYFIREATGLTLLNNVGPDVSLKRGQAFELISHALNTKLKGKETLLLSTLSVSENAKQQFLANYTTALLGCTTPAFSVNNQDLLDFVNGYTYSSYDLYAKSQALVARYPQILEMEILGFSTDARPIYVLRMTHPINEISPTSTIDKMHIFIDAGIHARETYNPFLVLRIIEDYAKDYYNNAIIPSADMQAILENNVLHFMPLLNPDGFDIVKFGPRMIKDPLLKSTFLQFLGKASYSSLKANVRGVDLNRNYDDEIFDTNTSLWKSIRGILEGNIIDNPYPNLQYFGGTSSSSEVETRISENYMLRYDFRAYLSYHSQGRIVIAETFKYGLELENQSKQHEELLRNLTGYNRSTSSDSAYGYANRFVAFNTYKTLSTIETMTTTSYPSNRLFYKSEYDTYKLSLAPLALISQAQKDGYAPYKIYVNGQYVRDIMNITYATAISKRLGGTIALYSGKPFLYLNEIPINEKTD